MIVIRSHETSGCWSETRFEHERELQRACESHLHELFGLQMLASEFPAGHERRIDTLAVDERDHPVIIEYKRASCDTLINQAVDYHHWLRSNPQTIDELAAQCGRTLNWTHVRVICVAHRFSRQDQALLEWLPFVERYEYSVFGPALMLSAIEPDAPVRAPAPTRLQEQRPSAEQPASAVIERRFEHLRLKAGGDSKQGAQSWYDEHRDGLDRLLRSSDALQERFLMLDDALRSLGLQPTLRKTYVQYSAGCNWISVNAESANGSLKVRLNSDPQDWITLPYTDLFIPSGRGWGYGRLQFKLSSAEEAAQFIEMLRRAPLDQAAD